MPDAAFTLHQKVWVKELAVAGRVLGIYTSETGIQYQVRYFYNGDAKTVYFFSDEIEGYRERGAA